VSTVWGINGERVYGVLFDPAEREALHKFVTEFRINAYPARKATGIGILQVSSLFQVLI
jgi:muconolactone delta-isomerase